MKTKYIIYIVICCLVFMTIFIYLTSILISKITNTPEYICNKNDGFWTGVDGCDNLCNKESSNYCPDKIIFGCWCGIDGCWDGKKCRPKTK